MVELLKSYIINNKLIDKANVCFWEAFKNWKQNKPLLYAEKFKNIDENALNLSVQCVGLRSSEWPACNFNHVTVSVRILHEGKELGTYVVWFSLNGNEEDDDDFLEI